MLGSEVSPLRRTLVVSSAVRSREALGALLGPRCEQLQMADTRDEGWRISSGDPELSLVIVDLALPDGDGFELLEQLAKLPPPRPGAIAMAESPSADAVRRCLELGALGCVPKPLSHAKLAPLLRRPDLPRARRAHRKRVLGQALFPDPDQTRPQLSWEIADLSTSGALLETHAPMPVGTELVLILTVGPARTYVGAEVVRVQEPSWEHCGGVGVSFRHFSRSSQALLQAWTAPSAPLPAGI